MNYLLIDSTNCANTNEIGKEMFVALIDTKERDKKKFKKNNNNKNDYIHQPKIINRKRNNGIQMETNKFHVIILSFCFHLFSLHNFSFAHIYQVYSLLCWFHFVGGKKAIEID